jgi:hypothetical protein
MTSNLGPAEFDHTVVPADQHTADCQRRQHRQHQGPIALLPVASLTQPIRRPTASRKVRQRDDQTGLRIAEPNTLTIWGSQICMP